MLKLGNPHDINAIEMLCNGSILGTKILCYLNAYGFDRDFLNVWIDENYGVVSAVITKFYDDVTILYNEQADADQLCMFVNMVGFNTVCCSDELSEKFKTENYVLKNGYRFDGHLDLDKYTADSITENDTESAYKLICKEIPGSFSDNREAYLSFLSDYTFRERRGLARGVCTHDDNKVLSVALTSSETKNAAIVSGVACDSSFKKRGLGKQTVLTLTGLLKHEEKEVYVIALNESAEGFYEHIGFKKKEKIAFIERNKDV